MFGAYGSSWIALGEPVGPPEERQEILWRFRELCDRYGAWPAFYQVTPESLPQFLELGLTFQKLGEEALVPLADFEVEGPERKGLRYTLRRLRREGCAFEIVPVEGVPAMLDTARTRSRTHWLRSQERAREGLLARPLRARLPAQLPGRGGARRAGASSPSPISGRAATAASCRST